MHKAVSGVENGILRFIRKTAWSGAKEGAEEALQAVLEPIFKSIVTGDKLNIDWSEVAYNALMGALTGGVFEAPGNAAAAISEANAPTEEAGRVPRLPRVTNAEEGTRTVPPLPKVGANAAAQSDTQGRVPSLPTVESVRQRAAEAEGVDIAPNQTVPGLESTSINDDPAQHTSEEMNRINEYKRATDVGILNFINKVRGLKNPKYRNSVRYPFSDVTPKAVQMVRTLTGVDASGFKNVLTGSVVDHVTRRHGAHGKADHSMANDNDIARMRYVLDNFDNAALLQNTDGTPSVSDVWKNSDGTPAQRIIFTKKIDGTYYVVEATPDSNAKVLAVESVFIGNINRSTGTVLNIENDSPQVTSETPQRANAPANNVSQPGAEVNKEASVNALEAAADVNSYEGTANTDKLGVGLKLESLGGKIRGKYENGVITLNSDRSDRVMEVFVHELTHHLEGSGNYGRLRNAALSYISENMGANLSSMKANTIAEYAEGGIELDDAGAERELVAQFCSEMVFTDEESIIRLARTDRNLAQRIYDWICDTISKIGKNADARALINARRMYENALRTVGDTQGKSTIFAEAANVKYSISPSFNSEFNRWLENGKPDRQQITVGTTSDALKSIGVDDKVIKWDTSKINKIQREHLGMSDGVIRQVPNIIENPILVMESKTQPNRLTMFGEVYNDNGLPVMAVLELRPTSRNNYELDQIKVANAYSKDLGRPDAGPEGTQNIIDTSEILYVEPDKKRTDTWLSRNQLHLPLGIDQYGPIGSIALVSRDSQGNFSADSKLQEIPEWKKKLQSFDAQASYGSSLAERAKRVSAKVAEKGNFPRIYTEYLQNRGQSPTDGMPYAEHLLKQAEKKGNIYAKALIKAEIEKAQRHSHKAGIDPAPMPTIYADHIKAREDDLQRLIEEAEEVLSEGSVSAAGEESISADSRDKLGEITARGTSKIKQGFSAFSKDDILFERAERVKPDGNKFDVAMHGTSQSVAFGGREENMSPRLLAAIIKHNKDYQGQEIRLLSCNTGRKTNDDYCFAEELANALGVTVYAPNDLLIFNDDGTLRIGRSNLGRFVPYGPNERRRLK